MKSSISPVVPPSIDRAKSLAKQLHEIYPQFPLSKAQEVAAKLMFWDDWHALNKAVKSGLPPGPFDSELSESESIDRIKRQAEILCLEMNREDKKTDDGESTVSFASKFLPMYERLNQANERYSKTLAIEAVIETSPTSPHPKPNPGVVEIFKISPGGLWMKKMPKRLAIWWKIYFPDQPEVANALETFKLNENRKTSLLRFGQYWGTLCAYYSDAIPIEMVLGTAYILAQRFATIELHRDPEFLNFVADKLKGVSEDEAKQLLYPWYKAQLEIATVFLQAYPRDDVLQMYRANPNAVMEIGFKTYEALD